MHIQYHHFVIGIGWWPFFNFYQHRFCLHIHCSRSEDQNCCRGASIAFGSRNMVDDCFKQVSCSPSIFASGYFGSIITALLPNATRRRIQLSRHLRPVPAFSSELRVHNICGTRFDANHYFIYTNHNGVRFGSNALRGTNFVWGMGQLKASTTSTTPIYHFRYVYFAAGDRVTRCINDLDFCIAVMNGSILRQNGNAALLFRYRRCP